MGISVKTMRRVDAWLGVPACGLLTVLRRLRGLLPRRRPGPITRILFLKLAEQGSTVLAHGALERAIDLVGRENVHVLVFEENRDILDAMGQVLPENVLAIRTRSILGTLGSTIAAVWRARGHGVDAAVDLEFFARSTAVLSFLSGAKRRVGLHPYEGDGPWRGDLLTHRVQYNAHLHTSQLFDALVRALEEPVGRLPALAWTPRRLDELPPARFQPSASEVETVRGLLAEAFPPEANGPLVLLNANCSDLLPLRRWEDAKYVALAGRLLAGEPAARIAFTGAVGEAAAVEHLVRDVADARCVSLAGRTTMRELLVLYGLSDVLVTNDSGPAHFASLTGTDVVTLFGPETPRLFGVASPRSHVVWAGLACSPCVTAYNNRLSACRDNLCMQRITVDEVLDRVIGILRRRASDAAPSSATGRSPPAVPGRP